MVVLSSKMLLEVLDTVSIPTEVTGQRKKE